MRPIEALHAVGRRFPEMWRRYDYLLSERGRSLPDWPQWCHCPMAAAYSVVSDCSDRRLSSEEAGSISVVAALAAWRPTQGIYRFAPEVLEELWRTDLSGEIPAEHLTRLPEWCVYIETPGRTWLDRTLHGYWAHLEWDAGDEHVELRLLLDLDSGLAGIPIHLGPGRDLSRGLQDTVAEAAVNAQRQWQTVSQLSREEMAAAAESLAPLVSVLLYLCADDAEMRPTRGRGHVTPVMRRGREGSLYMPAAKAPEVWETAYTLGARLREAASAEGTGGGSVRGHIRRAHWHTYRIGEGRKATRLRWLHPIAVNLETPDRPTVRNVETK